MRNSDDMAIPLRWAHAQILSTQQHHLISSISASAHQHQLISSISSISASAASAHQQHQRISSTNALVISIGNISAHIHQVRSYQSISINNTRRAPDTTRHAPDTTRHHQTPSDQRWKNVQTVQTRLCYFFPLAVLIFWLCMRKSLC